MTKVKLSELSKKTLGSYVRKSAKSIERLADGKNKNDKTRRALAQAKVDHHGDTYDHLRKASDAIDKHDKKLDRKQWNRHEGIGKAVKKLAKEETMKENTETEEVLATAKDRPELHQAFADIIDSIYADDAVTAKQVFDDALTQRVADKIMGLQDEVAENMFAKEEDEVDEVIDEIEDELELDLDELTDEDVEFLKGLTDEELDELINTDVTDDVEDEEIVDEDDVTDEE